MAGKLEGELVVVDPVMVFVRCSGGELVMLAVPRQKLLELARVAYGLPSGVRKPRRRPVLRRDEDLGVRSSDRSNWLGD